MSNPNPLNDLADWPVQASSRQGSVCSSSQGSQSTNVFAQPQSPLSPPSSDGRAMKSISDTVPLALHPAVTVSFIKGSRLFKLRYSHIDVCKDPHGNLRCIELSQSSGLHGAFVHAFPNSSRPRPHLEQPIISGQQSSFAVSFLEEQTVQTAQTLFNAQPHYTFDNWEDCVHFQEIVLDQDLVFIAGLAEAKSKGRGEECVSQNLRIFRARNGRQSILFFANSQRKEKKGYVSIPLDCVDHVDPGKKAGKPASLRLRPNSEQLAKMKELHVLFLDESDQKRFCGLLLQGVAPGVA